MSKKKKHKNDKQGPSVSGPLSSGEMPEQSPTEVNVTYTPAPTPRPRDQRIHPRQIIPPVPEGECSPDHTPSPPVDLD